MSRVSLVGKFLTSDVYERIIILLFAISLVLIAIDQLVKYWAVESLQLGVSIDFIRIGDLKIVDLNYLENDGAIFNLMSGQKWFLIGFTMLIVIIGIVAMVITAKRLKFLSYLIMLFISGGISNLIDRVRFGYVVDMFEIKIFKFAIFNIADIYVTFAFILFLWYIYGHRSEENKCK